MCDVFVFSHSAVANFKHIQIIPLAGTSLLSEGCQEIDDTSDRTVYFHESDSCKANEVVVLARVTYGIQRVCSRSWMCRGIDHRIDRIPGNVLKP